MATINQLTVSLNFGDHAFQVGELVMDGKTIYFKYYPSFLETALEISPFKLKLSQDILTPDTQIFNGLFGIFNDSLPDGWGTLLLDRTLMAKGIPLNAVTPLDRLAYVGTSGMGALTYAPKLDLYTPSDKALQLDAIATEMLQVQDGFSSEIIDELYSLGGSSGGARPKIFVGYNPQTKKVIHGADTLPKDYEHWIIKFPSQTDLPDIANIEYAYYKMALDAGISMSKCELFTTTSGKTYFGTKRFDRDKNKRLHLHSVSGLLHDNFRYSTLDYGNIMDCAFLLENHVEAYTKVLRLAAFNVYSHNRDDYSKNISFLMDAKGNWQLAPAYDLTYSYASHGLHSTMVAGESKAPGRAQLMELATIFGVKHPEQIIAEVQETLSNWEDYAKECGVSDVSRQLIGKTFDVVRD
jgi:serine/threonine-protein kinase HipA